MLNVLSRFFSSIYKVVIQSLASLCMCVCVLYRDTKMLALTGFHNWFKSSIHKWLQIVHEKSSDRIRKAVEMDQASWRTCSNLNLD